MTQRHLKILLAVFFVVLNMSAQQRAIFSHYMFNHYYINAGAAGSGEMVAVNIIQRNQWIGIDGAPVSTDFNVHAPFKLFGTQSAFGVDVIRDELGFNLDTDLKLGYAMRFNVGNGKLSIGIAGGFIYPTLDAEFIYNESDIGNGYGQTGDDPFNPPSSYENKFLFNLDGGIYYYTDDLYLGISSSRVNAPELEYSSESGNTTTSGIYDFTRHYYLITGYNVYLANPAFEIQPSFIVETDGKVMSFDINGMLVYNKKVWGGVSYRNAQASYLIGMIGLELMENLNIGLAYDCPSFKWLSNFTSGTVEIMLNYNFSLSVEKTTQRYKSIRYL